MKKNVLNIICIILLLAIIIIIFLGIRNGEPVFKSIDEKEILELDEKRIYLKNSGVEVSFQDVILSNPHETRKLTVSEQTASAAVELTDRIIEQLDFDFLKKTQTVTYQGTGYFVVDLDKLTSDCIIDDKDKKTVTILIDHAYLNSIDINPNDIMIADVNEGLLAKGNIKLTVKDYQAIEKQLRSQLEDKFNTVENGQQADQIALKMVKEIYEPIIQAIDRQYSVDVRFK